MTVSTRCFLCSSNEGVTEEHVFPQWLLRLANIRNQFVTLKNGTKYKYGIVKVPCCKECNSEDLSQIESRVSVWVKTSNFAELKSNPDIVFIWLYKIMYGLNYKEMHIKEDIKNPLSPALINEKEFFERISFNLFPLFAKGKVSFHGFKPYSLFVFKISEVEQSNYFYFDEPYKLVSAIAVGNVGIACSFQCDGYIEEDVHKIHAGKFPDVVNMSNFGDFCAYLLALKSRLKNLPSYTVHLRRGVYEFNRKSHSHNFLYNDNDPKVYTELITKPLKTLFNDLIEVDTDGNQSIKYKSPFIQF